MDLLDDPTPGQNTPEFTVSEISGAVKRTLEGEFGRVRVRGEVSRVIKARSGHMYYDIKDDRNQLSCTTWKGQVARLSVIPEEGLEVVVTGRITAYGAQSKYNMNVDEVAVAGKGALMALLEKRKKQLEAEGLFETSRKRPLPYLPEIIGVVTSPTGAVIRDILHRLRDRFPRKVLIWPVAVQGEKCAPEVAAAIAGFNALEPGGALPRPDLIIVARGGGSVEDLWGFNEESVARAAAASDIPLISAVGHETDTTLIDFVSDKRAPTPTAAAELAVPVRHELIAWVEQQDARMRQALSQGLTRRDQRLRDVARALPRPDSLLESPRQLVDTRGARLAPALMSGVQRRKIRLADVSGSLRPAMLTRAVQAEDRQLKEKARRLQPALLRALATRKEQLETRVRRYRPAVLEQEYRRKKQHFEDVVQRLGKVGEQNLDAARRKLDALGRLNETLSYKATLARGFAVVRSDGAVVTDSKTAKTASSLEIQFADGRVTVGGKTASKKSAGKPPEQGSLF
ncbi:exodeoxyribonuclease VII large subunit [Roseobacter sp. OBYS 0001]|uniref:exodeoxyribonuclease VII large subunit n=1 Tax=Roseobacter sp. OBYS 0001 TaxID=882651 RepID=UPI001BBE8BAB|nr:exodeoxyribonuclease VII large subunit [Roseobacter sp. OBYS 0001]GIT89055.1 exodeoxyribonuclease 7 large subunit [Roseobacter sp. OBYS 0001]